MIRFLAAILSLLLFLSSNPVLIAQSARSVMTPAGGGVGGGRGAAPALQNAGAASAAATAARARETLAHTDNQVAAMRALQASARAAMVPTSYNGLHPEGLQPHATAQWVGADAPVSTVDANGNHRVEIVQQSQNAFLYWNRFNVGSKTMLNFNQSKGGADAGKWIAFNKVMGSVAPSEIHGSITAQGQVYILNQNGIIFHNGSQVNTRGLVASSLPINPYFAGDPRAGVEGRGILNNTDYQFLFSALKTDKSPSYAEIFDPGTISASQIGGVVVERGAVISAPTSAANTGGRVMLAGSSVVNRGSISTPDGQTILAAGLQVGVNSHPASDPSLRGLDVHIGRVVDASGASVDRDGMLVGTVVNEGMIDVPRGNATLAGRMINQSGVLESSTTVSVNGRFDLMASFNAVVSKGTTARPYYYDPSRPEGTTGSILFGPNSLTRILPEWSSAEKLPGTTTALPSLVSALAGSIRLAQGAYIHSPGADVPSSLSPLDMTSATRQQPSDSSSLSSRLGSGINLRAGNWAKPSVQDYSLFLLGGVGSSPAGSITLDPGSLITAAGSTGTMVPFAANFLSVQLRGPELANSPLQRSGSVRGANLTLDSRITGTYNGQYWIGTPLGDATGFLNLIERTAGELTAKGGTIALSAGDRISLNQGSSLDVSGGWVSYDGGFASTSKLLYGGHLIDISQATPDRVYDGVYQGGGTVQKYEKWGVTKTFSSSPLDPLKKRYEAGYLSGANGGSIFIQAPSMQLEGSLLGEVVTGPRQLRSTALLSTLPSPASLSLQVKNSRIEGPGAVDTSPYRPDVYLTSGLADASGSFNPGKINLGTGIFGDRGIGSLKINNHDGSITVPSSVTLGLAPGGSLILAAANIDFSGSAIVPGGTIDFKTYNVSFEQAWELQGRDTSVFQGYGGKGMLTLGAGALLSTAGKISSNLGAAAFGSPIVNNGGSVSLAGYSLDLQRGSIIDVSGGALTGVVAQPAPLYGNAGSILISGGHDLDAGTITDGILSLRSTLAGYAGPGAHSGSLSVEAPAIQLGGSAGDSRILALNPDFFNQGGFSSFTLTGTGLRGDSPSFADEVPGIRVAPGTVIRPTVANRIVTMSGGVRDVLQPGLMKPATSVSLNSKGLLDPKSTTPVVIQGKTVIGEGAVIDLAPQVTLPSSVSTVPVITGSSISVGGKIVEISGMLNAPGGAVRLSAAGAYPENNDAPQSAIPTLSLLPGTVVSTAGITTLLRDPLGYGRRIGAVVNGGTVSLSGNISLAPGSLVDASGSSASLYTPSLADWNGDGRSAMNASSSFSRKARIDSDGGVIELNGKQMLMALGSLKAASGGANAGGGTLRVSSGRFYNINKGEDLSVDPRDLNLLVTQDVLSLAAAISSDVASGNSPKGYFYADAVRAGGFDSVQLGGNVQFSGPVSLSLPSSIRVATGGVISADNQVSLAASHVALGTPLSGSLALGDPSLNNALDPAGNRYMTSSPGPGSISVKARIIEIGNLLLRGLSKADLIADGGVIRGDGTFNISGNVLMKADQIYPVSASRFTVAAYANGDAGGEIVVQQSGNLLPLPLSAGGSLSLYASKIVQNGTLSAPFGTINLGWDGSGVSPIDPLSGAGIVAGRSVPVTQSLVMGAGGRTSVSAIDPVTGRETVIPYGIMINGTQWIDPKGQDISSAGLPSKGVSLSAARVITESGSVIDVRGGGDLIAYQWNAGLKGTVDPSAQAIGEWDGGRNYSQGSKVLYRGKIYSAKQSVNGIAPDLGVYWSESRESYALLPGFGSDFLPVLRFPDTAKTAGDPGFVSPTLSLGDKITLSGAGGLAGGTYTLLPSRYAVLPGAYLITPTGLSQESEAASLIRPDGTALVAGYRFNSLNQGRGVNPVNQLFEVLSPGGIRERSDLGFVSASSFLPSAQRFSPVGDAAGLSIKATTAMNLMGSVAGNGAAGGRGANIDLSSGRRFEIGGQSDPSSIALDAAILSSWKAGSLLIGGDRVFGENGIRIVASTSMITVHNSGSPLLADDLILAASDRIIIQEGARIASAGSANAVGATLRGNGAAIRVSSDKTATLTREGSSRSPVGGFNIASGALLSGGSIILDSSGEATLGDETRLDARALTLAAGAVNLSFDGSRQSSFLNLSDAVLSGVSGLDSLTIASYSGITSRGSGQLGSPELGNLTLRTGSFSGDGSSDVSVRAQRIVFENTLSASPLDSVTALPGSTLAIVSDLLVTGNGRMSVSGFADVSALATKGVRGSGDGALVVDGNLSITTPLFAGDASSRSLIEATGRLVTAEMRGPASVTSGLGSSLTLRGASVVAGAGVSRPSGEIVVEALSGDVNVASLLDVAGVRAGIHDLRKGTEGGQITLSSKTGDTRIAANGFLNAEAPAGGANAGSVSLLAPLGSALIEGGMSARSPDGKQGVFTADLARFGSLGDLGPLEGVLTAAGLTASQSIRIRTGDVTVSGAKASLYTLSADTGSILVNGSIDASGDTGGIISLIAGKSIIANANAEMSVRGRVFDNAGKGGSILLEAGANSRLAGGIAASAPSTSFAEGINLVDIRPGAILDLGVDQLPLAGQLAGVLHLRAPRTLDGSDLQINPIGGTVRNASSVVMEGFKRYDAASVSDASIDSLKDVALTDAASFMASVTARPVGEHRILSAVPGLAGIADFNPGIEIMNSMGGLVLNEDWDLSLARYGVQQTVTDLVGIRTGSTIGASAGYLRLKALGDITFLGSLSDGFGDSINNASQSISIDGSSHGLQFAQLLPLLETAAGKVGQNSWSYSITAGSDMGAVDAAVTRVGAGSVKLGRLTDNANLTTPSGESAMTASSLDGNYQVIRTGNGSIRVHAGDDIQLRNQFATIYTAGTLVGDQTLGGRFDIPSSVLSLQEVGNNSSTLGMYQQPSYFLPQYSSMGGDVSLSAAGNILRVQRLTQQYDSARNEIQTPYAKDASLTADSSRQLPTAWLMRRSQVKSDGSWDIKTSDILDPDNPEVASTTWWVNYANFFQGVGALAGGNVSLEAAGDIRNMDVSIPTQGRLTARAVSGGPILKPSEGLLTETGGGDMIIRAGGDIDAGIYYVERGNASLRAGGSIVSNKTRDAKGDYLMALSDLNNNASSANPEAATWLPTSFFAGGKSQVSVVSRGDALLGPVGNVFLMPQGINNDLAYKNYFSTYGLDPAKGVTDFAAVSLGGGITLRTQLLNAPAFQTWAFHNGVTKNGGKYQPWVRTLEADPSSTELSSAAGLMAPNIRLAALGGDLLFAGAVTMAPSPNGNGSFAAKGDIQGIFKQETGLSWGTSLINLSDASTASIPSYNSPLSQESGFASSPGIGSYLASFNAALSETASYSGANAAIQGKIARHDQNLLHRGDAAPMLLYADGDISGIQFYSPKMAKIIAGNDLSDVAVSIQHLSPSDVSLVSAGGMMRLYDANSERMTAALKDLANLDQRLPRPAPRSGDLQISGPGLLQVLSRGDIDLGTGDVKADGTGVGISSIGNARNPALPFDGADVFVGAGLNLPFGLNGEALDVQSFVTEAKALPDAARYLQSLKETISQGAASDLETKVAAMTSLDEILTSGALNAEERARLASSLFYIVLREAGRDYNREGSETFGTYANGEKAISSFFKPESEGDIRMNSRDIRTKSGGAISMMAPGGGISLAPFAISASAAPPGIVTESGGGINIFTKESVSLGIGRIFTLRGGDIMIWSDQGDIAAGSSAKTVATAPPTRVVVDPQSGEVLTDLAGLATGGGIGVLATVKGVPPGNVDLIAPVGAIDAGDAGIRSTGNLNLAAARVLNANNISVGGSTSGAPAAAPPPAAPNVSGATSASAASAGNNASAQAANKPAAEQPKEEAPSVISVEVLGYGGGDAPAEEEEKKSAGGASVSPPQASL